MNPKRNTIIYWIATVWLGLGMASTGIVQLIPLKVEEEMMQHLGYPLYFLELLGVWKLLGVIAILVPGFPRLKEWAYAGFVFAMSGAIYSHIRVGDAAMECFGPSLLILLSIVSWYFRPASRKTPVINS